MPRQGAPLTHGNNLLICLFVFSELRYWRRVPRARWRRLGSNGAHEQSQDSERRTPTCQHSSDKAPSQTPFLSPGLAGIRDHTGLLTAVFNSQIKQTALLDAFDFCDVLELEMEVPKPIKMLTRSLHSAGCHSLGWQRGVRTSVTHNVVPGQLAGSRAGCAH